MFITILLQLYLCKLWTIVFLVHPIFEHYLIVSDLLGSFTFCHVANLQTFKKYFLQILAISRDVFRFVLTGIGSVRIHPEIGNHSSHFKHEIGHMEELGENELKVVGSSYHF